MIPDVRLSAMTRVSYKRRRTLLVAALAMGAMLAEGCMPTAEGGPVDKQAVKAARRAKQGVGRKKAARVAANFSGAFAGPTGAAKKKLAVFEPAAGYIVKGTDFLTFWPCDSVHYYYLSAAPLINSKISQQYKFASPRPYLPMYGELRLRYVSDTLVRGDRTFARYVDVVDYVPKGRDDAKCKAPSRNTLSNELERLDHFKAGVLIR